MPSKTLYGIWAFLDFALLVAGGLSITFSVLWRAPDVLRNLVITDQILTSGLMLGVIYILAFVISIGGVLQHNHVVLGLKIFNWVLIVAGTVTLIIGTIIWYPTLTLLEESRDLWDGLANVKKQAIQDQLQCCGFANSSDLAFPGGFCITRQVLANVSAVPGCGPQFNKFTDFTLNNIFTTIYGFMAIIVSLFVATMCVIHKRLEKERFRKIDEKRGRSFV